MRHHVVSFGSEVLCGTLSGTASLQVEDIKVDDGDAGVNVNFFDMRPALVSISSFYARAWPLKNANRRRKEETETHNRDTT